MNIVSRDDNSLTYLPYDLVVVPKEKLSKKEYFTLSATGVMHVENGDPNNLRLAF